MMLDLLSVSYFDIFWVSILFVEVNFLWGEEERLGNEAFISTRVLNLCTVDILGQ